MRDLYDDEDGEELLLYWTMKHRKLFFVFSLSWLLYIVGHPFSYAVRLHLGPPLFLGSPLLSIAIEEP